MSKPDKGAPPIAYHCYHGWYGCETGCCGTRAYARAPYDVPEREDPYDYHGGIWSFEEPGTWPEDDANARKVFAEMYWKLRDCDTVVFCGGGWCHAINLESA